MDEVDDAAQEKITLAENPLPVSPQRSQRFPTSSEAGRRTPPDQVTGRKT
ncbi:hypothetical protein [Saccharopolyspora spinosa]|nr:hypothetical protein [Saccharopolyspora spinosa]